MCRCWGVRRLRVGRVLPLRDPSPLGFSASPGHPRGGVLGQQLLWQVALAGAEKAQWVPSLRVTRSPAAARQVGAVTRIIGGRMSLELMIVTCRDVPTSASPSPRRCSSSCSHEFVGGERGRHARKRVTNIRPWMGEGWDGGPYPRRVSFSARRGSFSRASCRATRTRSRMPAGASGPSCRDSTRSTTLSTAVPGVSFPARRAAATSADRHGPSRLRLTRAGRLRSPCFATGRGSGELFGKDLPMKVVRWPLVTPSRLAALSAASAAAAAPGEAVGLDRLSSWEGSASRGHGHRAASFQGAQTSRLRAGVSTTRSVSPRPARGDRLAPAPPPPARRDKAASPRALEVALAVQPENSFHSSTF